MSADTHISETVSAGQLRAFIERVERLEEEIKTLNGDKSEVYKEMRGVGFDVKAVRQCVAARKLDSAEREERTAIFDLYWDALTGSSRVRAHEGYSKPVTDTQEQPVTASQSHSDARNIANMESDHEVTSSAVRAGHAGQPEKALTGQIETQVEANDIDGNASLAAREGEQAAAPIPHSPASKPSQALQAKPETDEDPVSGTISDDDIPAFLRKQSKPMRPHCLNPDLCAGSGSKHCYSCLKARDDATVAA